MPSKPKNKEPKLRKICDTCSQRRYRCNGQNPCNSCTRRLLNCHYSYFARRKPKANHNLDTANVEGRTVVHQQDSQAMVGQLPATPKSDDSRMPTPPTTNSPEEKRPLDPWTPESFSDVSEDAAWKRSPESPYVDLPSPTTSARMSEGTLEMVPLNAIHLDIDASPWSYSMTCALSSLSCRDLEERLPTLTDMLQSIYSYPQLTPAEYRNATSNQGIPRDVILLENLRLLIQVLPLYYPDMTQLADYKLPREITFCPSPLSLGDCLLSLEEQIYHPMVVHRLVTFFFKHHVYWEPFLQSQKFFLKLGQGVVQLSLLNSVLCFATQLYRNAKVESNTFFNHCREYFVRGEYWVLRDVEYANLDTITSLLILAVAACGLCDPKKLEGFAAISQGLLLRLELHLTDSPYHCFKSPRPWTMLENLQVVSRRRAFWGAMFVTNVAALVGKTNPCFNMDQVKVSHDNQLDYREFFVADDPHHTLPTIIWPLFNGVAATTDCCKLNYILNRVVWLNEHRRVHGRVNFNEVKRLNEALGQWFHELPPDLRMVGQPGSLTIDRYSDQFKYMLRNNGLMNLAYYLCIFTINAEEFLQQTTPTPSPADWTRSRNRILVALAEVTHTIAAPVLTLAVPDRPLNCYYYACSGLLSALPTLSRMSLEDQARYKLTLDTVYIITYQYFSFSLLSRSFHHAITIAIRKLPLAWEPPVICKIEYSDPTMYPL
ncbi:hypothetical protein IWQ61_004998 [Dispira simplex]|nr:hypothetical protein IWQ61_004998 [Dispira simplex]